MAIALFLIIIIIAFMADECSLILYLIRSLFSVFFGTAFAFNSIDHIA